MALGGRGLRRLENGQDGARQDGRARFHYSKIRTIGLHSQAPIVLLPALSAWLSQTGSLCSVVEESVKHLTEVVFFFFSSASSSTSSAFSTVADLILRSQAVPTLPLHVTGHGRDDGKALCSPSTRLFPATPLNQLLKNVLQKNKYMKKCRRGVHYEEREREFKTSFFRGGGQFCVHLQKKKKEGK